MKKFFEKAKLEIKFKKAGGGHTLSEDKKQNVASTSHSSVPAARGAPCASTQRAGEAALLRINEQEKAASKKPQSATATWKHESSTAKVKKEIEAEKYQVEDAQAIASIKAAKSVEVHEDGSSSLSVEGIFFRCPLCPMTVPLQGKDTHLRECLENEYTENPQMAAASMVQSLNKDKDKVKACIDVLCRYIDNVCKNPGDEKFRKIKQSNKVFQERVAPIIGAREFIVSCGFEDNEIQQEEKTEHFYVIPNDKGSDTETLETYKAILTSTEPIKATLDRNLRVFCPTSSAMKFELPDDFFSRSSDEIKREYQAKLEEIDKSAQLRTKAMREAEKKPSKTYRFTLIRVRFPDGVILQGTFYAREKLRDLLEFVRESLESDWQPFVLSDPSGQLKAEESTLTNLGLVPAAVVNFAWDANIMADIVAASGSVQQGNYLKSTVMALIQELQL